MSETQNNIIRFNYLVDPTTLMSDSWITTNTDTTQNTVTPVGELITRYWRTITFSINTGKSTVEGVFKVEVNVQGVPEESPYYEDVSGSSVSNVVYNVESDTLTFKSGKSVQGAFINFSTATENTDYTDSTTNTTCSYVASSTTRYDSYNVELYVNSDVTVFPNNLFYNDDNIVSIEFDTYSITLLEDGINRTSGAFTSCDHLTSVLLPDNLEYIGDYAFYMSDYKAALSSITLPSTLNEIGTYGLYVNIGVIITSLAVEPPIIDTDSISSNTILKVHETVLQSYINSDWGNSVDSISTIETPTYDDILKFNYSIDPTEILNNLWVNSCTDTIQNTVEGKGETITITKHWREVSYSISSFGGIQYQGVIRIGWENNTYSGEFEVIETVKGNEINLVTYNDGTLTLMYDSAWQQKIVSWSDFDTAVEGQEYSSITQVTQIVSYTNTTTTTEAYSSYEVTLYLNSALTTFETTIFENDTNLLSIELPGVITEITEDAFNGCTNLTEVTIYATNPPAIYPDTFAGISDEAVLYVPGRALKRYRSSGYSTYFASIMAIYEPTGKGFNFARMIDIDYMVEVDPIRYIR